MDSNLAIKEYSKEARVAFYERRCEIRFKTVQIAMVTALDGTAQTLDGEILNVSSRGMKLKLDRPLKADTPVRIDIEADLILGEVRYCTPHPYGSYELGIEMDQVLTNAKEVARGWTSSSGSGLP